MLPVCTTANHFQPNNDKLFQCLHNKIAMYLCKGVMPFSGDFLTPVNPNIHHTYLSLPHWHTCTPTFSVFFSCWVHRFHEHGTSQIMAQQQIHKQPYSHAPRPFGSITTQARTKQHYCTGKVYLQGSSRSKITPLLPPGFAPCLSTQLRYMWRESLSRSRSVLLVSG